MTREKQRPSLSVTSPCHKLVLSFGTPLHPLNLFLAQGGYYKLNSLESLPLKSRINVIAYVTGVTEVKKSAGGESWTWCLASHVSDADAHIDWGKTYHLSDPSRPESMKGFAVNLFSKAADWLPDAEVGQILILRSLLVCIPLLFL